jgi:hypothetical protein
VLDPVHVARSCLRHRSQYRSPFETDKRLS